MNTRTYDEPRTTDTGVTKSTIAGPERPRATAQPKKGALPSNEVRASRPHAEYYAPPLGERISDTPEPAESPDLRAGWIKIGGDELAVVSFSFDCSPPLDVLTRAEQEVAMGLLEGLTNAKIAQKRGTKERTVANQVGSIFRKIGVSSRIELVSLIWRTRLGLGLTSGSSTAKRQPDSGTSGSERPEDTGENSADRACGPDSDAGDQSAADQAAARTRIPDAPMSGPPLFAPRPVQTAEAQATSVCVRYLDTERAKSTTTHLEGP